MKLRISRIKYNVCKATEYFIHYVFNLVLMYIIYLGHILHESVCAMNAMNVMIRYLSPNHPRNRCIHHTKEGSVLSFSLVCILCISNTYVKIIFVLFMHHWQYYNCISCRKVLPGSIEETDFSIAWLLHNCFSFFCRT